MSDSPQQVNASSRRRVLGTLMLFLSLAVTPFPVTAQLSEHSVKAAFLYKFLGYVEWPVHALPQPGSPIGIGMVGADEIAAELDDVVSGRLVNNHPVVVHRLREGDSLEGIHLLFIGNQARTRIAALSKLARQRGILLVTESEGALEAGSMINFLPVEYRVRFEVANEHVESAGLKLSSRLLAVAYRVETGKF